MAAMHSCRIRSQPAYTVTGQLNKQIAAAIGLSEITVKTHRGNVMRKMEARTFADLVLMAQKLKG